jgi:hypothetical protein
MEGARMTGFGLMGGIVERGASPFAGFRQTSKNTIEAGISMSKVTFKQATLAVTFLQ